MRAPSRYIALLRGINVGRAKRIAMADLRQLIAELGYGDVRTLLNSGNAVFTAKVKPAAAAAAIQEARGVKRGVAAKVTVISADELDTVMAENPLLEAQADGARLLVFVLADPARIANLDALAAQQWEPEVVALGTRAVYLWCPEGVLDSKVAIALGKQLGDGMTARNWNTISKLKAMCAA